jgi:hypothetical protein
LTKPRAGDQEAAAKRLTALAETAVLEVTEDVITLAGVLIGAGGLPSEARVDALHVAIAAVHGMNYLLTMASDCSSAGRRSGRPRVYMIVPPGPGPT